MESFHANDQPLEWHYFHFGNHGFASTESDGYQPYLADLNGWPLVTESCVASWSSRRCSTELIDCGSVRDMCRSLSGGSGSMRKAVLLGLVYYGLLSAPLWAATPAARVRIAYASISLDLSRTSGR